MDDCNVGPVIVLVLALSRSDSSMDDCNPIGPALDVAIEFEFRFLYGRL